MEWIITESVVKCGHDGRITNKPSQDWVHIARPGQSESAEALRLVLVEDNPLGRDIVACPNYGPTIKPCLKTVKVVVGYSEWIRIDGKPVVLSNLNGLTDGTPPGTVRFDVREPRQDFVRADR